MFILVRTFIFFICMLSGIFSMAINASDYTVTRDHIALKRYMKGYLNKKRKNKYKKLVDEVNVLGTRNVYDALAIAAGLMPIAETLTNTAEFQELQYGNTLADKKTQKTFKKAFEKQGLTPPNVYRKNFKKWEVTSFSSLRKSYKEDLVVHSLGSDLHVKPTFSILSKEEKKQIAIQEAIFAKNYGPWLKIWIPAGASTLITKGIMKAFPSSWKGGKKGVAGAVIFSAGYTGFKYALKPIVKIGGRVIEKEVEKPIFEQPLVERLSSKESLQPIISEELVTALRECELASAD